MGEQPMTPEVQKWILDQAVAGCSVESLLQAMQASGWDEELALSAIESTLEAHAQPLLTKLNDVPEIKGTQGGSTFLAHDREVKIIASLSRPRVVVIGGFLSEQECEEMIALARPRLNRSLTVESKMGGNEVNVARTSQGMFFGRGENTLCARLEARISALCHWPVDRGEGLQVLHYTPGAEYKPHYDYFDPAQPGTSSILKKGGQRVGTLVMYLNTPTRGGATVFPDVGLESSAIAGNAVFFSYALPHPMTQTLHGGAPVIEGEKWVATKWMREQAYG